MDRGQEGEKCLENADINCEEIEINEDGIEETQIYECSVNFEETTVQEYQV